MLFFLKSSKLAFKNSNEAANNLRNRTSIVKNMLLPRARTQGDGSGIGIRLSAPVVPPCKRALKAIQAK